MEKEVKLETYIIKKICDKCQNGQMVYTGVIQCTNPPLYSHKCNKCEDIVKYEKSYPYRIFKETN